MESGAYKITSNKLVQAIGIEAIPINESYSFVNAENLKNQLSKYNQNNISQLNLIIKRHEEIKDMESMSDYERMDNLRNIYDELNKLEFEESELEKELTRRNARPWVYCIK
jgi:hypothetical protein